MTVSPQAQAFAYIYSLLIAVIAEAPHLVAGCVYAAHVTARGGTICSPLIQSHSTNAQYVL
jgi:hypothetical protein